MFEYESIAISDPDPWIAGATLHMWTAAGRSAADLAEIAWSAVTTHILELHQDSIESERDW